MVGFKQNDTLTSNQKLFSGIVSGIITRFITQPLDIIKLRTQLQKKGLLKKIKVRKTAKRIFFEEGLPAFWQGHILGQVHSILSVSSQFFVYELATRYVHDSELRKDHKSIVRFMCGIFAGCCSATIVNPLEVIRVRQMLVKDQYGGMIKGAHAVYRYGGFFAFYEGLGASLLQMGPQVGISFFVFSNLQPFLIKHIHLHTSTNHQVIESASTLLLASSFAGSVSGFISKTLTYPFDLAKRRLQIGTHKKDRKYLIPSTSRHLIQCSSLPECLYTTFQKEGVFGLFRGWSVTVWKAQVTSVVAFTAYELMCFTLREIQD